MTTCNPNEVLNLMPGAKRIDGVEFYPTKPAYKLTEDEAENARRHAKNSRRVELAWETARKPQMEHGKLVVAHGNKLYRTQKFPGAVLSPTFFEKRKPFARIGHHDGHPVVVKL